MEQREPDCLDDLNPKVPRDDNHGNHEKGGMGCDSYNEEKGDRSVERVNGNYSNDDRSNDGRVKRRAPHGHDRGHPRDDQGPSCVGEDSFEGFHSKLRDPPEMEMAEERERPRAEDPPEEDEEVQLVIVDPEEEEEKVIPNESDPEYESEIVEGKLLCDGDDAVEEGGLNEEGEEHYEGQYIHDDGDGGLEREGVNLPVGEDSFQGHTLEGKGACENYNCDDDGNVSVRSIIPMMIVEATAESKGEHVVDMVVDIEEKIKGHHA